MADPDLRKRLVEATKALIAATGSRYADGADVARYIDRDPDDAEVYDAFREMGRLGELDLQGWRGGMGLPAFVFLLDAEPDGDLHPASRRGLSRYLSSPFRWAASGQERNIDRIAVLVVGGVLGGVILAAIVYFAGFQAGGSTPAPDKAVATQQAPASTASATAPVPGDGRDPNKSHCSPPAEDVPRTAVPLRGRGLSFGTLVLRHSPACNTAWGSVRGLGQEEKLRLVIVANRPSDHATTGYSQFGGFVPEGVYGNELFHTHGCVVAIAVIQHAGQTLARARTPCR
jgi:hypothetical protein